MAYKWKLPNELINQLKYYNINVCKVELENSLFGEKFQKRYLYSCDILISTDVHNCITSLSVVLYNVLTRETSVVSKLDVSIIFIIYKN